MADAGKASRVLGQREGAQIARAQKRSVCEFQRKVLFANASVAVFRAAHHVARVRLERELAMVDIGRGLCALHRDTEHHLVGEQCGSFLGQQAVQSVS
jgi:hypothetical protein